LDGSYTVFGEIVEGLEIVEKIQGVQTDDRDRPLEDVVITRMVVEKKSKNSR
jgi:peptidyl-prolyl cis-trans isomerase B (cyclophilin B)